MKNIITLIFLLLINSKDTFAASDSQNTRSVISFGDWNVYRTIDDMTDKVVCTVEYKKYKSSLIHLTNKGFYIIFKPNPNIDEVTIRFDEKPHIAIYGISNKVFGISSLADQGIVALEDDNFLELLTSKRLKIRVVTSNDVKNFEFNLSSTKDVIDSIENECPIPVNSQKNRAKSKEK